MFKGSSSDVDSDGWDDDYFAFDGGDEQKEKYKDDINNFSTGLAEIPDGEGGYKNPIMEKPRGCTDIQCVIIYWAFLGVMCFAVYYGFHNGRVDKLIAPIDAAEEFCGFGEMKGFPKMIFNQFEVTKTFDILKSGVCVKECPTGPDFVWKDGGNYKNNAKQTLKEDKKYKAVNFLGYCLPVTEKGLTKSEWEHVEMVRKAFMASTAGTYFMDLYNASRAVYWSMGLSIFWSLLFIYIMSIFAEYLAWCCVILVQIGLFAAAIGGFFFWDTAVKAKDLNIKEAKEDGDAAKIKSAEEDKTPLYCFIGSCVFALLAVIFFFMLCCKRKALGTAIDVIDASADYIADNKRVLLVPVLHSLLQFIVIGIWFAGFLCVASLNEIEIDTKFPQAKNLKWEKKVTYACLGMFFGILWITAVIDYTSRFIVIMGACTYYFNNHRDSDNQKGASIMFGVKAAYINHHGSIAFAGFIIAVIRFIKYCFYYAAKKAEKVTGENPVAKCAVKCAMCILNCIEKIVDYINENALCYQAVTGEWFCPAAYNGFILNLKHGAEFIFVKVIAKVFIFIGKVGITVGNCFSCYAIMKYITEDLDELSSVWTPIIMVGLVTYVAACLFLALYEEAVQSLLVCVCVDMDMNGDGLQAGEPKFGPKTFHDNYKKKVTDKMNKTNDME